MYRIFNGYAVTIGIEKFQKEFFCFKSFVVTVNVKLTFAGIKSASARVAYICTRRVRDYHIPPAGYLVPLTVHSGELAPSIDKRQNIAADVPFRVSSGAFLNIAGIGFMTKTAHFTAYGLAFFAGNQNSHCVSSFLLISGAKTPP